MNKIKEARIATGLSRADVAKIMEVPYRTWENWESDNNPNYPKPYFERLILKELKNIRKWQNPPHSLFMADEGSESKKHSKWQ